MARPERRTTIPGQFRLLIINSEPHTTRVFREAAHSIGAKLTTLATPEEAARCIGEERFEAIFADPGLPHFSRQGLTRLIGASRFNSLSPLVLIMPAHRVLAGGAAVATIARPKDAAELLPFLERLKERLLADRRKNRRLPFRTAVNCVQGLRRWKATSVNLSATGILLESSLLPKCGDEIDLHFQLATDKPIFHSPALVVRLDDPNHAGLAFENLSGDEQQRLRRFVESHLPDLRGK